uniref:Macaca fascicularis brain cDNA, clone: QflA-22391 n=1 Tax=Macaca fascicularis TaxID=9541 RepID=I7GNU2_MACFA|nr:unnamed protein product [Macaca fascicularis]
MISVSSVSLSLFSFSGMKMDCFCNKQKSTKKLFLGKNNASCKKKKNKHTSSFRKQFVWFLEARKWGWG